MAAGKGNNLKIGGAAAAAPLSSLMTSHFSLIQGPLKRCVGLLIGVLLFTATGQAQVRKRTVAPDESGSSGRGFEKLALGTWSPALQQAWRSALEVDGDNDLGSSLQLLVVERLAERGDVRQALAAAETIVGMRRFLGLATVAEAASQRGLTDVASHAVTLSQTGLATAGLAQHEPLRVRLISSLAAIGRDEEAEALLAMSTNTDSLGPALAAWLKWQDPAGLDKRIQLRLGELQTREEKAPAARLFYQAKGLVELSNHWRASGRAVSTSQFLQWQKRALALMSESELDGTGILLDVAEALLAADLAQEADRVIEPLRAAAASLSWGVESTPARLLRLAAVEKRLGSEEAAKAIRERAQELLQDAPPEWSCEAQLLAGTVVWRTHGAAAGARVWKAMLKQAQLNPNANIRRQMLARMGVEVDRLGGAECGLWDELMSAASPGAGLEQGKGRN
jgi:hypothetical protein